MIRRILLACAILLAAALPAARAQSMAPAPTVYTYDAEWTLPRAQWGDFEAFFHKNIHPELDKLLAEGKIIEWGFYRALVHAEDGTTHGIWWSATSIAALIDADLALMKTPAPPNLTSGAKHKDFILRDIAGKGKLPGSHGYLLVANYTAKPGKMDALVAMVKHDIVPAIEASVAAGDFSEYAFDDFAVHTINPNIVAFAYLSPNANLADKLYAAIHAFGEKNPAVHAEFASLTIGEDHRDFLAEIVSYGAK